MRTITRDEFLQILESHKLYLGNSSGECADLRNVDLSNIGLRDDDLVGVNLSFVDFEGSNLSGLNLSHANLRFSNLRNANLSNANLYSAVLCGADLSYANLENANLNYVNLQHADLFKANLKNTDLRDAKSLEDVQGWHVLNVQKSLSSKSNVIKYLAEPDIIIDGNFQGSLQDFKNSIIIDGTETRYTKIIDFIEFMVKDYMGANEQYTITCTII